MRPRPALQPIHAGPFSARPNHPVPAGGNRQYRTAPPLVRRTHLVNDAVAQPDQPGTARARPEIPLPVFHQRDDPVGKKPIRTTEMQGFPGRRRHDYIHSAIRRRRDEQAGLRFQQVREGILIPGDLHRRLHPTVIFPFLVASTIGNPQAAVPARADPLHP